MISIKLQSNFIKVTLWDGCSPVNLLHTSEHLFIRTPLEGCFGMVGYHKFTSDEQNQPPGGACKVAVLKNFAILEENNCVGVSF